MSPILVTGATGTIGCEIARQLQARGEPIRVLVRNAAKLSGLSGTVEVVVGDFAAPESLDPALRGVERLFLASFDRPEQPELQRNLLDAAKRLGVRHIVRMSTMGVHEKSYLPIFHWHADCERQLEDSGLAYTHLRPSWVMQNFLFFVVGGRIRLPAGEGRVGFVDARDIAAVAVEALSAPGHEGRAYDLTGPEALSHADVADQLSAATGRPVVYENISPDAYAQEKASQGWPTASIESLVALFADVRAGHAFIVTDTVERITGRPPFRFHDFARDYASDFETGS